MPTWNLHVVGQKAIEDLDEIGADIVKALEGKGHQLLSATLTDDDGPRAVPVAPPPDDTESEQPTPEVPVDTPPDQVASGETA